MAVGSLRRGRGFHKRRLRPNVARAELAEAAKTAVKDTVEPPLVRRQGKGKGGDGKGNGKGKGNKAKGKAAEPSAPPAPPLAAEPLPTTTAPSNSIVLNPAIPAQETVVPPLNPPSTVAPPAPPPPPALPGAPSSSSVTTSTAVTSVQTTQTSIQTQTTVVTTAQTSTQVSTQVTTIVSTQIDTSTSLVGNPMMTLTSFTIASPLPTLQTSLSTTVSSTSTPFVASTPYQAAPSGTTTSPASSRAPAIAPGTIAGIVVGILSFFFIILGAVCLCSRRTRRRLLTPVTRRFTNNASLNSGSRGVYSTDRRSARAGDMHKSLMSEAESMAYTTMSPRDVKPPPMAMVEPSHGLSQNPVFMGQHNTSSRPNSWRTWRPSATFAQGLDPLPDDLQLPPPPPHALTARYSGFPRGSGVSTGGDSSMPEYGAWPPMASNADLTALTPGPGQQQNANLAPGYVVAAGPGREQSRDYFRQQEQQIGQGYESYVTYSETPLATPRTPIVVEGEQLAPLATSQEASPVDNCDYDSGESGDAGRRARSDDIRASEHRVGGNDGGGFDGRRDDGQPEGGIQEAQLGREAGAGGGHGGGPEGVEEEPPREQGKQDKQAEQDQQDEQDKRPGERGEQVFEEVAAVQGQPGLRRSNIMSQWSDFQAPPSLAGGEVSRSSSSSAGFSWSEAASEPYTAAVPRDGFGLSIIGARHGSRRSGAPEEGRPGPSARPDGDH